ncbi:MAG TPA: hypothetical protein VF862_10000 [Gemmatimonadales bacterium]
MDGRAGGGPAGRPGPRWRLNGWVLAWALAITGCYTMTPVTGPVPEVGTMVAFAINDAGRAALGGSLGPEVDRIEGRLLETTDDGYLLAVSSLTLLRGGQQVWQGEQVRVSKQYVNSAFERRFSMGRTIGAGAIVVGGFAAFLATRSLLGAGQSETKPPSDSGQTHVGRP